METASFVSFDISIMFTKDSKYFNLEMLGDGLAKYTAKTEAEKKSL